MPNKIILVDGNSIINRAFYGLPLLTNKLGEFTNAVYGFLNMVLKLYYEEKPTHLAVAFDLPKPTFRHELFSEYKAKRKAMPNELRTQFVTLKNLLQKMGINYYEKCGFEADDILGTLAKKFENENFETIIFSGDSDLLQIASEKIKIFIPKSKKNSKSIEKYDEKIVFEKIGVTPKEFIDVKALMGDKSDNIPGVPGVGEKSALKIIAEHKSIENALENLNRKKNLTSFEKKLCEHSQNALFCKKLVTINTHVPIEINFDDAKITDLFNIDALQELKRLDLNGLINRFGALC